MRRWVTPSIAAGLALAAALVPAPSRPAAGDEGDGFLWLSDIDRGLAESARTGRPVLIVFR